MLFDQTNYQPSLSSQLLRLMPADTGTWGSLTAVFGRIQHGYVKLQGVPQSPDVILQFGRGLLELIVLADVHSLLLGVAVNGE